METKTLVKGYKAFNPDFTCNGMKYAENETFEIELPISICNKGLHFCLKASHVFSYYDFNSKNIVCEVEAIGEVQYHGDDSKACTNILKVGRRLTWEEVLQVANDGVGNTGHSNTGDSNTGDRNTGDRNTGDWNTGDRNTGYSNTGDRNTGVFCTGAKHMDFFDKKSDWTEQDFFNSKAYQLLQQLDTKIWVYPCQMTDEEKAKYTSYKTCDGYLKDIPFKEAFQNAWHNWDELSRNAFRELPNFDKDIFKLITGVDA